MENQIKEGDTVVLRGQKGMGTTVTVRMTAEQVYTDHEGKMYATCVWHDGKKLVKDGIACVALTAVEE